ncbi:MAG: sulfatase-like hydrolase/transferase [Saprospiraceae bacterium]|nr:sulfatase-like hydrolase/transferase [Saprospiraceae bacterium]
MKDILLSLCMFVLACLVSSAQAQKPPNVIVILSDDQGSIDMGAYGVQDLLTPNLDRLASSGLRFTQFYAGSAVCSPSRASLLTGKVPHRAGVPGNAGSIQGGPHGLPPEEITMAEVFKNAGYATAHIGKWHLGYTPDKMPNAQGFDYSFGHMGGCIDNYSHFFYWNGPNRHDLHQNGQEVFRDGHYFPDLMVEEAQQFIINNQNNPFFIYFAINMPHYPYQGDEKWLQYYREKGTPYPRDLYNAFVSSLDERIGRLIDFIDEQGLRENTIIVFQSDHGHSTEERAHFGGGNSGPYRGAKFSLFEGGIRVPALISWPGRLPQGEVRNQMLCSIDWLPTLAELTAINLDQSDLDGRSFASIIRNEAAGTPHPDLHWQMNQRWAVRKGKWKLLYDPHDTSDGRSIPENTEENMLFLVDLSQDVSEQKNRSNEYPEVVKELEELHHRWESRWTSN